LEIVNKMKKNQKGFSLIELLIVVVIIGIIAAIAIPNLLAARRSANEGSAISSLRTYHGAQMTYQATEGGGEYAGTAGSADVVSFTTLSGENLIDSVLGSGTKSGYVFTGQVVASGVGTPAQFAGRAVPTTNSGISKTGSRNFGIATEGVMFAADADTATNASITLAAGPPVELTISAASALSN
jgi:prepilin-type N-terminal cleavage/methylation domain-containing protein